MHLAIKNLEKSMGIIAQRNARDKCIYVFLCLINDFENYMGFKGTMTVDGEDVEIVFREVGLREVNEETYSFIDDEITWYSEAADPNMFGMLFDEYGPSQTTISGKLIVEGGKLTMKMDENQNNQYEPDEITVFTKAK